MTGLEIVVLAPLAYGVLHLGKKVIEQREIIDNQMETLAQQQLALEAQRAAAAEGGAAAGAGAGPDTILGKVMMVGSLSIAGAMTAYNFYQIRSNGGGRRRRIRSGEGGSEEEATSEEPTPVNSNTNTLTSSTNPLGTTNNGNGDANNTNAVAADAPTTLRGFLSSWLPAAAGGGGGSQASSQTSSRTRRRRTRMPPAGYQPQIAQSEAEECKVCMNNQRDTLVTPCNHFAMCWECAEAICFDASGASGPIAGHCPVCRVAITSLQFAYV